MNHTPERYLTLDLPPAYHQVARQFAREQATVAKGKKVYLNTLAVYGVRDFFNDLPWDTNLEQGDSWNLVARCFSDVADLVISGLGKLECCPILPQQVSIELNQIVREDRIAYVIVRLSEDLHQGELVGFFPASEAELSLESLDINELIPIENLIDYLFRLEMGQEFLESDDPVAIKVRERLKEASLTDIIIQLERVVRTGAAYEQRYQARNILVKKSEPKLMTLSRDAQGNETVDIDEELEELAEDLLDKFKEIWET